MKLLIILVVVLGVVAAAQLAKVYEHARDLRQQREEDISLADNKFNSRLWLIWMIVMFVGAAYFILKYGWTLPEPASEHGADLDSLLNFNFIIIIIVFYIVNFLLFYFSYKYYYRKERRAKFFPHDNRLEVLWTLVPSLVLVVIIVYGLMTWNKVMGDPEGDYMAGDYIKVEVTGEQWSWYVRYPGQDKVFGDVNVSAIDEETQNNLGIITYDGMDAKIAQIEGRYTKLEKELKANAELWPEGKVEDAEEQLYKFARQKQRLKDLQPDEEYGKDTWTTGSDDVVTFKKPLHLPVGVEVELSFRSKDVIHSAYMPHFRAQMNTVPGVPTKFKMTPTITTAEMRRNLDDPEFDYILLCNKICGASHYNMWIPIIVESQSEYEQWLSEQATFGGVEEAGEAPAEEAPAEEATTDTTDEVASAE